jgi:hypothetical protein
MRICEKHRERATETLVSQKTGTEYDLCPICIDEMAEILTENPIKGEEIGRKRTAGRPKTNKG